MTGRRPGRVRDQRQDCGRGCTDSRQRGLVDDRADHDGHVDAPTTGAAAFPTTTVAVALPGNVAGYIYNTYYAWAAGDRASADLMAEPAAVDTLFSRTWSNADGWAFVRCEGVAGSVFPRLAASSQADTDQSRGRAVKAGKFRTLP